MSDRSTAIVPSRMKASCLLTASCVAMIVTAVTATPSLAQTIRCSAFLHLRDGSWRSFEPGIILGPRGPIRVETGDRFRRGAPSGKDYIAHMLDALCQSR